LLDDVRRLKKGVAAISPEFFGFSSWKELVLYVEQEGDQQLRTFVKLVEVNGEEQLLEWLKQTTETEEEARIVLSTAHKAKGREWPTVLVADDFASAFDRCVEIGSQGLRIKNEEQFKAEARLFYVAMTRGLDGVELPKIPMLYFGITPTTQTTVRPVGMGVIPPVTHTQEEPYIDPTSE
jgi:superfamily I DNA/RNA helicase